MFDVFPLCIVCHLGWIVGRCTRREFGGEGWGFERAGSFWGRGTTAPGPDIEHGDDWVLRYWFGRGLTIRISEWEAASDG